MRSFKIIICQHGGVKYVIEILLFIAGATVIRPNKDYFDTQPKFYKKDRINISLSQKLKMWNDALTEILSDVDNLLDIVEKVKNLLKKFGH